MNSDPAGILFGVGVDKIKIGMGISELIDLISTEYPRLNFEINFPRIEKVLNQEIMVLLLDWGIRLRFQPVSQTLYMIDYYDISKRMFSIKGSVFGGGGDDAPPVTFEMLHKYLGPTLPGTVIEEDHFLCNFGGASFLFSILPEHRQELKAHLPVNFEDGTSAPLVRIFVYPLDLDIAAPKMFPDSLPARLTVSLKSGPSSTTRVFISPPSGSKGTISMIELGMTVQDVLSTLGDPAVAGLNPQTNSYRYEYPRLGLEFFFSESTHILFQLVLRNNLAHTTDFGRFDRCPFRIYYTCPSDDLGQIQLPSEPPVIASPTRSSKHDDATVGSDSASVPLEINTITVKTNTRKKNDTKVQNGNTPNNDSSSSSSKFDVIYGPSNEAAYIDPLTTDIKIRDLMCCWFGGSAMTKEASAQLPSPQTSPFADTLLYAYPEKKICFEVTNSDPGFISSVSLLDLELLHSSESPS